MAWKFKRSFFILLEVLFFSLFAIGSLNPTKSVALPGDRNADGIVTIDEVQRCVNQFLGITSVEPCCDLNGNSQVTIDEVQKVINALLGISSYELSKVIGPGGGIIEVTDLSSALYGVKIGIPAEALEQETNITISLFSKADLEGKIGVLDIGMRFFGGIKIDAGGAILKKPITVSLPNSSGATHDDQPLVGEVIDLNNKVPSEMVYKGVALVGSPLSFNVPNFGAFGVLSPTIPLGLIGGTFITQSGNPVPNGVIAASFSKPFVGLTNEVGYFEIPAGTAGSYSAIIGIPPAEFLPVPPTPTNGIGIVGIELPQPLPTPPTSIIDLVKNIIMDELDIPEPPIPEPCFCDPPPPSPWFTSKEDPEPPFELSPGQTIHTYLFGFGTVYGAFVSPWPNVLDLYMYLWSASLCITTGGRYWTDAPNVATVDANTGQLTATSTGETALNAEVTIACIKNCPLSVLPCPPYTLRAIPAQVKVTQGTSTLIVHAHNPEGVEIASIQGMSQNSVEIYDGDTLIGYGAYNAESHNKPIQINPGNHTIKVKFNGMTLEQNTNIAEGQTQVLPFTFERTHWDGTIYGISLIRNYYSEISGSFDGYYPDTWVEDITIDETRQFAKTSVRFACSHDWQAGVFHMIATMNINYSPGNFIISASAYNWVGFTRGYHDVGVSPHNHALAWLLNLPHPFPTKEGSSFLIQRTDTFTISYDFRQFHFQIFAYADAITRYYNVNHPVIISTVPYDLTGTGVK